MLGTETIISCSNPRFHKLKYKTWLISNMKKNQWQISKHENKPMADFQPPSA